MSVDLLIVDVVPILLLFSIKVIMFEWSKIIIGKLVTIRVFNAIATQLLPLVKLKQTMCQLIHAVEVVLHSLRACAYEKWK